jgi:hypothetical protein
MTRSEDNKRGGQDEELSPHGRKIEARSTKEQKAKTGPNGVVTKPLNRDFKDNTGGKGHNDIVADL